MSLLMDALKKAEKEKKEAAKRRQTGQHPILTTGEHSVVEDDTQVLSTTMTHGGSETEELTQEVSLSMELQPKDDDLTLIDEEADSTYSTTQTILDEEQLTEDTQLMENTQISDQTNDTILTLGEKALDDIDLDLEDTQLISDMTDETIIERTMETSEFSNVDYGEVTDELRTEIAEDNLDDETLGLKLEDLDSKHGIDIDDDIEEPTIEKPASVTSEQSKYQTNLGQITDPSLEMEALDTGSVTQMLRDIGQHEGQPTPVVASTVFAASKTENWGNRFMIGISAALGLLLIVAAGLFIQYKITPDVPKVLSPSVAKGVEAKQEPAIKSLDELVRPKQAAVIDESVSSQTDEIETQFISHDSPSSSNTETAMVEPQSNASVESVVENTDTAVDTTATEKMKADSVAAKTDLAMNMETKQPVEKAAIKENNIQNEIVFSPVAAPVSPSMIKISKTKKPRPEKDTNQRAFKAFQQGNYDVASSLYRISLRESPNNRDALLGMAAINLKKGNTQEAYQIYQKILTLNPADPVARVSLMNLQNQQDASSESTLKNLIQQSPNNPGLLFSLGNFYSQQQRWPEAQQAFFDAYSQRPDNPDYALNLAISLDHMGQSKAAIDYYRKAIKLTENNPASFSIPKVMSRVDTLSLN